MLLSFSNTLPNFKGHIDEMLPETPNIFVIVYLDDIFMNNEDQVSHLSMPFDGFLKN